MNKDSNQTGKILDFEYKNKQLNQESHDIAIFIEKNSSGLYSIEIGQNLITDAKLAAACIMQPQKNDLVQIFKTVNQIYITMVLEKSLPMPSDYILDGNIKMGLTESKLEITPDKITTNSRGVSIKADKYTIQSNTALMLSEISKEKIKNKTSCIGEHFHLKAKSQNVKIEDSSVLESDTNIQISNVTNINSDKFNINS